MELQIEIWQLVTLSVTLLIAFFAGLGGLSKVLYTQLDKRLAGMDHTQSDALAKFKGLVSEHAATTNRRIDGLATEVQHYRQLQGERWEKNSDRVARVEQSQAAAIGHSDLSYLHERINTLTNNLTREVGEVNAKVTALTAQLTAQDTLLRTIDQYLRDQAHRPERRADD